MKVEGQVFWLKGSLCLRTLALVALLFCGLTMSAAAQQGIERVSGPPAVTPQPVNAADDLRYRIGPGDVLGIIVRKAPELSLEAVRVDQRGMIRIPMIEGDVKAACLTESELSTQIAQLYSEYKRNPSVDVFVKSFESKPVAVIGAVTSPGQFRLQRRIRLLELLTFAGGPSGAAGRTINVIHGGGPRVCGETQAKEGETGERLEVLNLNETMKGLEASNPFVQPGDVISLPEADLVFVVGHVNTPRAIPLKDKAITISRAIAMAGGPQRDGKTSKIRIVRQAPDGVSKQEIYVDLKAIEKQRAEDVALLPNDVVEVGASASKTLLGILTGAISPAISNGAVRAIPGVP